MLKVNYKYVPHGEKFTYEGQEYTKINHGRAMYHEDGKTIHRNFKQLIVVDTNLNLWDSPPKLKG